MRADAVLSPEERLRSLQLVTDSALDRLNVDELLAELLERTRAVLNADTAAVLVLDLVSEELVVRAACGFEEVERGERVSCDVGFAGDITQTCQPVFLQRVDATTVTNPRLWEKGIRVMLGVPLLAGRDVIGVLHVGRLADRPFDTDDSELLQVVARRFAGALQASEVASQRAGARFLERSLMPGDLPQCRGLEFATRYQTPEGRLVGGDWYDVFSLPSGDLWLVTADVAGHGLRAAVVMGRTRSALRSYALVAGSPAEVLELTDRKVQHFEIGTLVTVVCVSSAPPYDEIRIASAGHPPPVLVLPGRAATLVEIEEVGPPLGTLPGVARSFTTVAFPPGALLLTYTDGLVERRDASIQVGFDRLCAAVRADRVDTVCSEVMGALLAGYDVQDDVAVAAMRRDPGIDAAASTRIP